VRLPRAFAKPIRVYVDAKILNVHDPDLPRRAFVGYVVEGDRRSGAKEVAETESDDAEVRAILFAIDELAGAAGRLTVICDHESVVAEANRDRVRKPSPLMQELRETLARRRKTVELRVLQANPAHGVVTAYVNSLKDGRDEPTEEA
jgi:ribonuclease HI